MAGTVYPLERALVAARVAGTVTHANFAVGQRIAEREIVLALKADEFRARAEQARAALAQAKRELERESALLHEGAAPAETMRAAEDRVRLRQALCDEAETLLEYTAVRAPFSGYITRKYVDNGDFASVGAPLFELEQRERMRLDLAVPETLPSRAPGETLRVLTDDSVRVAWIVEVSPALDPATRTRQVIAEFPPDTAVPSGGFLRALWPAGEFDVMFVPAAAVTAVGQIERVFVVKDAKAVMRLVRTGETRGPAVQILSGLEAGETVIVSPPPGLRDGASVATGP